MRANQPLGLALIVGLVLAAPADAAETVTWKLQSQHVDIQTARLGVSADPPTYPATPRDALRVTVYLPDGYDGTRSFPVLYLLHGSGWSHDYWSKPQGGNLAKLADRLDMVVVMPEGARGWYMDWWNGGRRDEPGWESFHLEEVMDAVSRRLKIRPERRWHAIAGFSMGGYGAVRYAAARPDYFGSVASLSGFLNIESPGFPDQFDSIARGTSPLFDPPGTPPETHTDIWGDPQAQSFYWRGNNPLRLIGNLSDTRVFVSMGNGMPHDLEDLASAANGFAAIGEPAVQGQSREWVAAARSEHLARLTVSERNGLHTNYSSNVALGDALGWGLFGEVPTPVTSWSYRTVRQHGIAWGFAYRFDPAPAELETLRREGSLIAGEGAGAVTLSRGSSCRLRLSLPFSRRLPAACLTPGSLRLSVSPRRVRLGRRVLLRFRARAAGSPAAGVRIALGRRVVRTGSSGRAALRYAPRQPPGDRMVRATKAGLRSARARLRVAR